jgi:hypothetical protein
VADPTSPSWYIPPLYPQTGAWVGTSLSTPVGVYVYEYNFCLCPEFDNVEMRFTLWADNSAIVLLNDEPLILIGLPTGLAWWTGTGYVVHVLVNDLINDHFVPGSNTLTIEVSNASGPSGMMVSGWITADPGRCCP